MDAKERFYRKFQSDVADIEGRIARLASLSVVAGERKDASDSILASLSRLSLEVADAAEFIPAYDQRTYSQTVKSLTDKLNDELGRLAPTKPRFQFKKSAKTAAPKADHRLLRGVPDAPVANTANPVETAVPAEAGKDYNAEIAASSEPVRRPSFSAAKDINISGHTGVSIVLPLSAAQATASGSLTDLAECVVDMAAATAAAPFKSLMLRNIQRSLIVVGRVSGPVHITGLTKCILVVSSRQVRIHECVDVDVYLDVRSRPIIEDCRGMRFAPLELTEKEGEKENLWDQVDDFKWLRAEASPNWSVLPEGERRSEWEGATLASLNLV